MVKIIMSSAVKSKTTSEISWVSKECRSKSPGLNMVMKVKYEIYRGSLTTIGTLGKELKVVEKLDLTT